ncbi:aspartate-semialdehyde dehydrogenase [Candidatus Riflebacteria bacterium]
MKIPISLLAATGTVGQKAISLINNHPVFELAEISASPRNKGKAFCQAASWRDQVAMPDFVRNMELKAPEELSSPFAISALPAEQAKELEPHLAEKGIHIFSNAGAMRMRDDVPLMIPEVNGHSLGLVAKQKTRGKIITNPNCATVFFALALGPVFALSKPEQVNLVTLQGISGAGYPGIAAMDILGNVVPFIKSEEMKIEWETKKILSEYAPFDSYGITVNVNRVAVAHGHTLAIHIHFQDRVSPADIAEVYQEWNKKYPDLFILYSQEDRPQPARDIHSLDQRVHIGRIRQGGSAKIISLVCMGHNLVRGAAGAALLNLEYSYKSLQENS